MACPRAQASCPGGVTASIEVDWHSYGVCEVSAVGEDGMVGKVHLRIFIKSHTVPCDIRIPATKPIANHSNELEAQYGTHMGTACVHTVMRGDECTGPHGGGDGN